MHCVTETQDLALAARELIHVTYENVKKPILTIEDAIQAKSHFPVPNEMMGLPVAAVKGDAEGKYLSRNSRCHPYEINYDFWILLVVATL